jgi:hypothetical protein
MTGFVLKGGGGALSWVSKRQSIVAQSSTEAEYVATNSTAKEIVWFRIIEKELGNNLSPTIIMEDNKSAIKLADNWIVNSRTKHIDVRYHFIRYQVEKKIIKFNYIDTNNQTADILTKSLGPILHKKHTKALGVKSQKIKS